VFEHLLLHVEPGDLVLTMGAGDIWKVSHLLVDRLNSGLQSTFN
jgi:UDP-N-acetylmuramate--alanine ligase